jgi:hypothetical protein
LSCSRLPKRIEICGGERQVRPGGLAQALLQDPAFRADLEAARAEFSAAKRLAVAR